MIISTNTNAQYGGHGYFENMSTTTGHFDCLLIFRQMFFNCMLRM